MTIILVTIILSDHRNIEGIVGLARLKGLREENTDFMSHNIHAKLSYIHPS